MQTLIAKIGRGQKTWKDLTWDEAKRAMRLLIEGQATPAQTGAFLLAMRLKTESVAELAAFTAVAREYVTPLPVPAGLPLVDLPCYAGKQESRHVAIAAAIVAVAAGAAVLMHGSDGEPERLGSAAVLATLGIPTDLEPRRVAENLGLKGFAFLDLALYHPPLQRLLEMRRELGVRTLFHPIAKMLNPARAGAQVIGVSHPPYFEKLGEALRMLGARQALILRGVEGEPELSIASVTRLQELRGERLSPLTLQPKDFGMAFGSLGDMAAPAPLQPDQEAGFLRSVLRNEVRGVPRNWVVMNAALLLYAAGLAPSVPGGVKPAQHALESGAAAKKLSELVTVPTVAPV